jgi:hypothetical protein
LLRKIVENTAPKKFNFAAEGGKIFTQPQQV